MRHVCLMLSKALYISVVLLSVAAVEAATFRDPFIYPKQLDEIKPPTALDCADLKDQFKLQLQGILEQAGQWFALINGDPYKQGMQWNGLMIEQIDKSGVVFIWYDKKVKCPLHDN